MRINLTLPLPPSLNRLYRTVKRTSKTGKTYYGLRKAEAGKLYLLEAWAAAQSQALPAVDTVKHIADKVNWHLNVKLFFKDHRRHDADNCLKQLQDSLAKVFGFDDSAIVELEVTKDYDKENPRVEVELIAIEKGE